MFRCAFPSQYSDEQAVDDGVLHRGSDLRLLDQVAHRALVPAPASRREHAKLVQLVNPMVLTRVGLLIVWISPQVPNSILSAVLEPVSYVSHAPITRWPPSCCAEP